MRKALLKDTFLEIKNNFKRFISILLIILLGVGFFAGLKATSPDMQKTVDKYFDDKNVMDIKIVSTLGLTDNDISSLKELEEINEIYGTYSKDAIANINNNESVIIMHSITDNNSSINQFTLVEGNLPENDNECLVEKSFLDEMNCNIGDETEIILETEKDTDPFLKTTKLKIVGAIESPLYISVGRGSTSLLSGKIDYYMYVPEDLINSDVYTEIYLTLNNAKELSSFSTKYEDIVDNAIDKLEILAVSREEERYNETVLEARTEIEDAQNELNEERQKYKSEIKDAENKIADARKTIEKSENTIISNEKKANNEFNSASEQLQTAETELANNEVIFYSAKTDALKQFEEVQITLDSLNSQLSSVIDKLQELETQKITLETQKNDTESIIQTLTTNLTTSTDPTEISQIQSNLYISNATLDQLTSYLKQVEQGITQAIQGKAELEANIFIINKQISTGTAELAEKEALLNSGKQELSDQKTKLEEAKTTTYEALIDGKQELEKGKKELNENESELEEAKLEAEAEFSDAQAKIDDANKKVDEIEKPTWYILDRDMNEGYVSYSQDSERIASIGEIFPMVFFIVAALISLTSMTRMVEEQRTQIGTLKALGYTKFQIAMKYIIYALLATTIGGIIGILIGFNFLPSIIINIYGIIYTLPPAVIEFNTEYAFIGMIVSTCCTVGATIYSCIKELSNTPANLMRPKSPKLGKRVLLENITFIWSRLSFLQKVTLRNMFRYKKRFLMTIIGVAGCTSLIVAGFGLRDSISHMIPAQYGEIFKYQLQTSFKEEITSEEIDIIDNENNLNSLKINMQSVEITGSTQTIQLIVPGDTQEINEFIELKSRKKDEKYNLDDDTVIITEKISKLLNIKVGDTIEIKDSDDKVVKITIGNITENYLMHYIYMSPTLYNELFSEDLNYNVLLSKTNDLDDEQEYTLAKNLLLNEHISSVTLSSDMKGYFTDILDSMNLVVWILIIAAGILALVVLYNLSNVNISERIREIATIKVLGFYDNETYQYISRETVILTIIGIIIGLFLGYFLEMFVLSTCELDTTMFDTRINILSYIYSVLITLFFSSIVSFMTHITLKKIDMIESLKSVE